MMKTCVVCGRGFKCPPTSKKITCSKACSSERKSTTHTGLQFGWTDEAKARLHERQAQSGVPVQLSVGTLAAQNSPIAGSFETNQEAKLWWVRRISSGEMWEIRNLRLWCREHADLFAPDTWEAACAGLRQVQSWLMGKRPRQVSRWKDWTLDRPAEAPPAEPTKVCEGWLKRHPPRALPLSQFPLANYRIGKWCADCVHAKHHIQWQRQHEGITRIYRPRVKGRSGHQYYFDHQNDLRAWHRAYNQTEHRKAWYRQRYQDHQEQQRRYHREYQRTHPLTPEAQARKREYNHKRYWERKQAQHENEH